MPLLALYLTAALCQTAQQAQPPTQPSDSVVKVLANSECATYAQGSGIVVSPGTIITSAHVVQGTTEVKVLKNGTTYYASGYIIAPELDLCLLRIPALPCPPVIFATEPIREGAKVCAIGFPGGEGPTVHPGLITGIWRFRTSNLLQSNAEVRPGSSGGGLFTEDGQLIGITTFTLSYQGLNFSVPATWISKLLDRPWQTNTAILTCKTKEALLQEFLDGMTSDPSNRPAWEAFSRAKVLARPNDPEAWYSLGHSLFLRISDLEPNTTPNLALYESARQAFQKALELNPSYVHAWNNLGVIQDSLGDITGAIKSFRMAVQLRDDYGLAWLNLGAAYFNTQQYKEGIQAFQRGLAIHPDEGTSWVRLAFCESALGQYEAAIRHLKIAIGLCPIQMGLWLDLAEICTRAKRPAEFDTALAFLRDRLPTFAEQVSRQVGVSLK